MSRKKYKFAVITKRHLIIFACVFAFAVFAVCMTAREISVAAETASAVKRKIPIYSVETEKKQLAISFDAAWGNEDTQTLIDIMDRYGVKATFFVVGEWVDKYPESVKALADAGHSIQNHSNTHPHLTALSRSEIIDEIEKCNDKIESVTGVRPTLIRVPYGDYDNKVVEAVESLGMYTIQWDVDSLDWKEIGAGEINSRVVKNAREGSIVLFHNAAKHTPEALPSIIEKLQAEGYEFVKISDLIYTENYEINHEGRQIAKRGE